MRKPAPWISALFGALLLAIPVQSKAFFGFFDWGFGFSFGFGGGWHGWGGPGWWGPGYWVNPWYDPWYGPYYWPPYAPYLWGYPYGLIPPYAYVPPLWLPQLSAPATTKEK